MNLIAKEPGPKRFRPIEDILKDPATKAKLTNLVDEAVRCKTKIQLEQETIKSLRDVARTELDLNPKLFNYYVAAVYNNDYSSRKESLDQLSSLMESIIGLLPPDHSAYDGDE